MKLNLSLLIIQERMNVNFLNISEQQKAYEKFFFLLSFVLEHFLHQFRSIATEVSFALITERSFGRGPTDFIPFCFIILFYLPLLAVPFPSDSRQKRILCKYDIIFVSRWLSQRNDIQQCMLNFPSTLFFNPAQSIIDPECLSTIY